MQLSFVKIWHSREKIAAIPCALQQLPVCVTGVHPSVGHCSFPCDDALAYKDMGIILLGVSLVFGQFVIRWRKKIIILQCDWIANWDVSRHAAFHLSNVHLNVGSYLWYKQFPPHTDRWVLCCYVLCRFVAICLYFSMLSILRHKCFVLICPISLWFGHLW